MRLLLRTGPFRTVLGGEFLSMLGDGVYAVAVTLFIAQTASPQVLAFSLIALGVPRGLLLLIGGAATDRFTARQVMFFSHLARGLVVAVLALLAASGTVQPWHFYVLSAAFGIADAFFWPASRSILPSLVAPGDLVSANAITSAAEQTTLLAGPLIGGLLMTLWGPVPAFVFNSATFAIAACTVLAAPRGIRMAREAGESTLKAVRAGLQYAWAKPGMRVVLLAVSAWTLAYAGLFGVGLPTIADTFSRPGLSLGLMIAASGLGQLLGAVCAGVTGIPRHWGLLLIGMAFLEALTFLLLGITPELWLIMLSFVVIGFGGAYVNDVAIPVWIQSTTEASMLGRVNSVVDVPRVSLEPVSMLAMGLVAASEPRFVFIAACVPMFALTVALVSMRPARRLQTAPPPS